MYVIRLDRRMMCHRFELEDSAVTTRGLCAHIMKVLFLRVSKVVVVRLKTGTRVALLQCLISMFRFKHIQFKLKVKERCPL